MHLIRSALRAALAAATVAAAAVAVPATAGAAPIGQPPGTSPPAGVCGVTGDAYGGPGDLFAISEDGRLLRFDGGNYLVEKSVPLLGLPAGVGLVGIDTRPATGGLYGIGADGRLYVLDPATGQAGLVGVPGPGPQVDPANYGIDFNPTVDRLRVVGADGLNARVNPTTGAVTAFDTMLAYRAGDRAAGTTPTVTAAAYTNSVAGATSTTLYGIDVGTDTLVQQGSAAGETPVVSPNSGQLRTIGALGFDVATVTGFDIVGERALATMVPAGESRSVLARIDLGTGRATRLVRLPARVFGLTGSAGPPTTVYATTSGGSLIAFSRAAPARASVPLPLTGLQPGESVAALDVRPANGGLYAIGTTNRLYRLDPLTGAADQLGGRFSTAPVGRVGMDFNPTVDRIRVVTSSGLNLRLDPDDGTITGTDAVLGYAPGDVNDGATPSVTGAAYTNNQVGATTTTLYDLDAGLDVLAVQNPPNAGTLATVGRLGVGASGLDGFDIAADGSAVAALSPAGGPSALYCVDLATGRTRLAGRIGPGYQLTSLAVAPRGVRP